MKERARSVRKELIAIVLEAISEQFAGSGFELIDLEFTGNPGSRLVRVYLDKEGGITLDECAEFSKRLSVLLDMKDPIKDTYTLEVSSPGGRKKNIP